MRFVTTAAFAALSIVMAGAAFADDPVAQLSAMCMKDGKDTQASCDCQAKAIVDNADPKFVQAVLALAGGKSIDDALKEAGLTQEQFQKLSDDAEAKTKDAMAACKPAK